MVANEFSQIIFNNLNYSLNRLVSKLAKKVFAH